MTSVHISFHKSLDGLDICLAMSGIAHGMDGTGEKSELLGLRFGSIERIDHAHWHIGIGRSMYEQHRFMALGYLLQR